MKIISNEEFKCYETAYESWHNGKEIYLDGVLLVPETHKNIKGITPEDITGHIGYLLDNMVMVEDPEEIENFTAARAFLQKLYDIAAKSILKQKEIAIEGVTLLSIEEYKTAKAYIPKLDEWWWLRSPGGFSDFAACVNGDGSADELGDYIGDDDGAMRPALLIRDLKASNLEVGDKIRFAGHEWTVIPGEMAVCDETVGYHRFDNISNDFETSEIKECLEDWLTEEIKKDKSKDRKDRSHRRTAEKTLD